MIILFGIIQGLTEFLPVSSSGHLTLFQFFTGFFEGNLTLNIAVHLGTLLTVLIFYRKDIVEILRGVLKKEKRALTGVLYIVVAMVPTVFMGLLMMSFFSTALVSSLISSFALLFTGAILFSTKLLKPTEENSSPFGMNMKIAFLIGCVQGFAVLPGLSRSGLTIVAALWLGVDRNNAAKFSFLISVPAIVGAVLLDLLLNENENIQWIDMGVGVFTSFFVGLIAIGWMVRLTQNKKLWAFSYYVWGIGLISLTLQMFS